MGAARYGKKSPPLRGGRTALPEQIQAWTLLDCQHDGNRGLYAALDHLRPMPNKIWRQLSRHSNNDVEACAFIRVGLKLMRALMLAVVATRGINLRSPRCEKDSRLVLASMFLRGLPQGLHRVPLKP